MQNKIDNFDQILNLLEFNNKDEYYFLQIIERKKMEISQVTVIMDLEL